MIFAAGLGTRLRPLTEAIPKPLIPVLGQPIIAHTITFLKKWGVAEVVINLHHHAEKIKEALGDGKRFGVNIIYSFEEKILGTGGGLKKAERLLSEGTFFLMNSDIIADVNLLDVLSFHRQKGALATMVLRDDPRADSYGAIRINREGRIRQFLDKLPPPVSSAHSEDLRTYMFTGIHVLEPGVFRYIPDEGFSSITDHVYPRLLLSGEKGFGYTMDGYWADLGTQESYSKALRDIESGMAKRFFRQGVAGPF